MDSDDDQTIVKAKRRQKPINKKNKVHLVFNEDSRREFLTGFHKRKLQRKKKAQEELKEILKAEKKRIKLEAKEQYKKLVHSYKPIPELEEEFAKEYDVEGATVSVTELDADLLAQTNFLIGRNRGQLEEPEEAKEEPSDSDDEAQSEMPGMELKEKPPTKKPVKKEPPKELKTKKEVKKELKKQSTKSVKKSKAFQKMNQLHTLKQKKRSAIKRRDKRKTQAKSDKKTKPTKRGNFKKKK